MSRILKGELAYLKGRLILAILVSAAPIISLLIFGIVAGGFANISKVNFAMNAVLGYMQFCATAFIAIHESPEPRARRWPSLMMIPVTGRQVWLEILSSRIVILLPAVVGSYLISVMIPEKARGFALMFASGFFSFSLLVLGLFYLHMGFKNAHTARVRGIIIIWDIILVGRIVVPMFFADWSTVGQPTTPPGKDLDWNDASNKMDKWEWISWAETIITYVLCYWTFTKRQSYLGK